MALWLLLESEVRFLFLFLFLVTTGCIRSVEILPLLSCQANFNVINRLLGELGIHSPVVIDAGAFDGGESKTMSVMWPSGMIHSFEPVPEIYGWLVKNVKACTNVNTYNLALGDFIGKSQFFTSEEPSDPGVPSMSGSLLAPKEHLLYSITQFKEIIDVDVTTLDQWGRDNGVDHVDVMWLDMQGYELLMLKASTEIFPTVKIICAEVELVEAYDGQPLYEDMKTWLHQKGFELVATDFDEEKPQHWFGNAIFVKR